MGIDWKRKLSSRKFWVALIGVVGALGALFKLETGTIEQVTALIMSFATLIAYVLAEGWVDASRESGDIIVETTEVLGKKE